MSLERCTKDRWLSVPQRVLDVFVVFVALRCLAALPFAFMVFGSTAVSAVMPCVAVLLFGLYALMFGEARFFRLVLVASTSFWVSVAAMITLCGFSAAHLFGALALLGFVAGEAFALGLQFGDDDEK